MNITAKSDGANWIVTADLRPEIDKRLAVSFEIDKATSEEDAIAKARLRLEAWAAQAK